MKLIAMKNFLTIFFLICCFCVTNAQPKEGIKVTDMLQIKSVGNIAISDDGKRVAFTVSGIEPDTSKWEYKYVTQVWLVVPGSQPRQLTFAKEGASQPAWSPDGKQIAFTRTTDGKPQIFLLPLDGGEAIQLTKYKYGASNPEWSKDGKRILFTATIPLKDLLTDSTLNPEKKVPEWPYEKPGFINNENLKTDTTKPDPDGKIRAIRNYLAANEKDNKAKVLDRLDFQEEAVTSSNINLNHVFIVEPTPGATPKEISHGFYSFGDAHFIDNNSIIMDGDVNDEEHPDRRLESEIFRINIDGTGLQQILGKDSMSYITPAVSASGKWLAYVYNKTSYAVVPSLAIMPASGKEEDKIEVPFDRNKTNLIWSKDENFLYFTSPGNGGVILCRFSMQTKKVETLTDFNSGITSYDINGNTLFCAKTEVADPSELFMADGTAKNLQRVTSLNNNWLQKKQLSFPEKHTFTNNKGMTVEYWVMKPVNYEAGKKYPLLLEIHGGPAAMWGPGENTMWQEFQFFCSKGYGVVYCNPRGSGGYGFDFLKANIGDWGAGPTSDVLTALDKTVAEGWADTSKLLVTGGSYAGYLVAWIIAHDHRFKAACSQRGVYDLNTFFGEGNAWRLVPNYFGGYPWEKNVKELLDKESPVTYVQNITTPYIIFHGENDLRTGVIQSEMLYKNLKALGRQVEYVRHPGATHEITRSGNNRQRIDQMLRTYEFFERFIH
ncbi:MAG TPA: S9 family peptidase [Chitinophagaceae bacterium]